MFLRLCSRAPRMEMSLPGPGRLLLGHGGRSEGEARRGPRLKLKRSSLRGKRRLPPDSGDVPAEETGTATSPMSRSRTDQERAPALDIMATSSAIRSTGSAAVPGTARPCSEARIGEKQARSPGAEQAGGLASSKLAGVSLASRPGGRSTRTVRRDPGMLARAATPAQFRAGHDVAWPPASARTSVRSAAARRVKRSRKDSLGFCTFATIRPSPKVCIDRFRSG